MEVGAHSGIERFWKNGLWKWCSFLNLHAFEDTFGCFGSKKMYQSISNENSRGMVPCYHMHQFGFINFFLTQTYCVFFFKLFLVFVSKNKEKWNKKLVCFLFLFFCFFEVAFGSAMDDFRFVLGSLLTEEQAKTESFANYLRFLGLLHLFFVPLTIAIHGNVFLSFFFSFFLIFLIEMFSF